MAIKFLNFHTFGLNFTFLKFLEHSEEVDNIFFTSLMALLYIAIQIDISSYKNTQEHISRMRRKSAKPEMYPYALTRINIRLEKPQTFTAILRSHKYLVVCILNGLFTECAMLHQSMTI